MEELSMSEEYFQIGSKVKVLFDHHRPDDSITQVWENAEVVNPTVGCRGIRIMMTKGTWKGYTTISDLSRIKLAE